MRRLDDVWMSFLERDNFETAAKNACKSRKDRIEVEAYLKKKDVLLPRLIRDVREHKYKSSKYRMFEVHEKGKTRLVADLPLYPDRILHWAIALSIENELNKKLIDQTHASRPGHGCHSAIMDLRNYLEKDNRIKYALQIDVRKFFPSMNKEMVKRRLREVLKDENMLRLLDSIIDDYPYEGIAIGNRISPMLANMVLSPLDHMIKEQYHAHYYVRYMDDIVILGYSKPWLHKIKNVMEKHLNEIGLEIKGNWQIYPIDSRGIQFVGYRLYSDHTLIRKNIKKRMKRRATQMEQKLNAGGHLNKHDMGTIASYEGILKWCNGKNLQKTTFGKIRKLNEKNMNRIAGEMAFRDYQKMTKGIGL